MNLSFMSLFFKIAKLSVIRERENSKKKVKCGMTDNTLCFQKKEKNAISAL